MIKLKCKCGKSLQVKSEHAGKHLKCPGCETVIAIPKPSEAATADESPEETRASRKASSKPKPAPKKKRRKRPAPPPVEDEYDDVEDVDYGDDDDGGFDDYDSEDDYGADEYEPALPTPSRKKKKKKKSKDDGKPKKKKSGGQSDISPKVMYSLFGLAGTVSAVVMFFIVQSIMSTAAADAGVHALPEKFDTFRHEHAALSSDCPDAKGWMRESGGGTGGIPPWIRYKNERQGVSINIRASISGTSIGDIASAGGGGIVDMEELPDELHPVAAVHSYQHDKISADYNTYEETEPQKIETGFGEGRVSDFTGGSTLSTEYGMRASLIANQYQYNVICKVPKKRLEEYRPVFERIIKSVGG